jgi:hypothetical protein
VQGEWDALVKFLCEGTEVNDDKFATVRTHLEDGQLEKAYEEARKPPPKKADAPPA